MLDYTYYVQYFRERHFHGIFNEVEIVPLLEQHRIVRSTTSCPSFFELTNDPAFVAAASLTFDQQADLMNSLPNDPAKGGNIE